MTKTIIISILIIRTFSGGTGIAPRSPCWDGLRRPISDPTPRRSGASCASPRDLRSFHRTPPSQELLAMPDDYCIYTNEQTECRRLELNGRK